MGFALLVGFSAVTPACTSTEGAVGPPTPWLPTDLVETASGSSGGVWLLCPGSTAVTAAAALSPAWLRDCGRRPCGAASQLRAPRAASPWRWSPELRPAGPCGLSCPPQPRTSFGLLCPVCPVGGEGTWWDHSWPHDPACFIRCPEHRKEDT